MADSWQKPLQYYKVISLQVIKINEKKKPLKKTTLLRLGDIANLQNI